MENVGIEELVQTEKLLDLDNYVTNTLYDKVKAQITFNENMQISLFS